MVDRLTAQARSANMRAIHSKNTKPELVVRKLVHRMGFRYRLHRYDLPGRPDLVFRGRRKVIFVHGCFWHQHKAQNCKIVRQPKSNDGYWLPKLERNEIRDKAHRKALKEAGWEVLVIWECQVRAADQLHRRLQLFLNK